MGAIINKIIICDVCGKEKADEFDKMQVITIGNEYEYGVSYWEDRPLKDKLSFHKVDLCEDCQQKLQVNQLRYIQGFHGPGKYLF